jgi:hypothetical protein
MSRVDDEARRLAQLFAGQPRDLVALLSGQLSVLKSQAQMLMGLAGLTITVTGFSGHNMVRGGWLPTGAMLGGIACILGAIIITLRAVSHLRWVTQDLDDDLTNTARVVIVRRDGQQHALTIAGALVALGMCGYLVAVVLAALVAGGVL